MKFAANRGQSLVSGGIETPGLKPRSRSRLAKSKSRSPTNNRSPNRSADGEADNASNLMINNPPSELQEGLGP